ncbi:NADH dehydrogenase FAD-containing subunit [Streptomyces sp. HNM0575]|uniref:proton-conducting transporter transmembrane domain-containing protein n=1 Tax=Streptomyces sp. HNM0575 TaxID=2716338 RepID=UPI00145CF082|nr:proton-conducting transporter membrane subunit [Streptomyces sp. HNM0575]NLU76673.1 NADH dehydrogenase FAD-containing subunit [Streptomyces sp. HNM0575]
MTVVLLLLALLPLLPAVAALSAPARIAQGLTLASAVVCFGLALALVPDAGRRDLHAGILRVDALSMVFVLATAFVYAACAAHSIGYLRHDEAAGDFPRYARRFYAGFNLFAWSMLCAPLVDGLALLWVAVEITTVVSALLVAVEDTEGATEAAWKYVLIASAGLGVALLATIFMYYAGAQVLGQTYDLAFAPLLKAAGQLPPTAVQLAFVLAVLGFGTKVGLVPVHTWLPDAHAEAPTPVSAMLSGSLLAVSFYAVLRYYQITAAALGPHFPQTVLLVFGVASLLLAALYLLGQHDIKRLLAYSSVEHMGILAIGVSFGAPLALAGVLLHVLAHAAAKGNAFMGAGAIVRKYRTKEIAQLRGGREVLPWSGPLFLLAVLALSAMPPFGIFRSEFQIVAGGLQSGRNGPAALLVVLVTLAFLGLAVAATRIVMTPATAAAPSGAAALGDGETARQERGEPSVWMVTPVLAGLAALVLLGLHPPADLAELLARGAAELGGLR